MLLSLDGRGRVRVNSLITKHFYPRGVRESLDLGFNFFGCPEPIIYAKRVLNRAIMFATTRHAWESTHPEGVGAFLDSGFCRNDVEALTRAQSIRLGMKYPSCGSGILPRLSRMKATPTDYFTQALGFRTLERVEKRGSSAFGVIPVKAHARQLELFGCAAVCFRDH